MVVALAVAVAGVLTVTGTRLAASQEPVLVAMQTGDDVPVHEPWDPFWKSVPALDVALSAQQSVPPMGGRRLTIQARAVNDGENTVRRRRVGGPPGPIGRSARARTSRTPSPCSSPASGAIQVPAFCMGDPTASVNIWQWRAAWQGDIVRGFQGGESTLHPNGYVDMYPFEGDDTFLTGRAAGNPFSVLDRVSPVDNLVAIGNGSLTGRTRRRSSTAGVSGGTAGGACVFAAALGRPRGQR